MNIVDGVLLLVDAAEGPMPRTHLVLKKALEMARSARSTHWQVTILPFLNDR